MKQRLRRLLKLLKLLALFYKFFKWLRSKKKAGKKKPFVQLPPRV